MDFNSGRADKEVSALPMNAAVNVPSTLVSVLKLEDDDQLGEVVTALE